MEQSAESESEGERSYFLQQNQISDMEQLVGKIEAINNELQDIAAEIRKVDRRLDTLALHFYHREIYIKHKDLYAKYKKLDPKKSEAFYDKHFEAIQEYEVAKKYLDGVKGDNKTLPINKMGERAADAYRA